MKISNGDKAILFLAAGLFILACINYNRGQQIPGTCWLFAAFGCGVMLYAGHSKGSDGRKK